MKLTVKKRFRDKEDHVTLYEPETILEVNDQERARDLVKRGLCSGYKGKNHMRVTLGESTSEALVAEVPEVPSADALTSEALGDDSDSIEKKKKKKK